MALFSSTSGRAMRTLMIGALLATSTAATAIVTTVDSAITMISDGLWRVWCFTIDAIFKPLAKMAAARWKNLPGPAVALLAARQFHLRQIKRDRPVLTPQWRSCASI